MKLIVLRHLERVVRAGRRRKGGTPKRVNKVRVQKVKQCYKTGLRLMSKHH